MTNTEDNKKLERIRLAVPSIGEGERKNLNKCVDDEFVSTVGEFVDEFERRLAKVSGVESAVAVSAGTTGLHASLVVLGVKPGDLVILPTFTFIASANAISHAGATPWLFDISESTWTLNVNKVRDALETKTKRTPDGDLIHVETGRRVGAIMPVYTLGIPADMDEVGELAKAYGLPVIADAAAAIGCTYKGRPLGALADLTVYSFNGNKTITTGGGGGVVGANTDRLKTVKHLTTTARPSTASYDHDAIGFNYRMTNIEAAVGCAQIERLEEFLKAKERIRRAYDEAFKAISAMVTTFPDPEDRMSAHWFSGIVLHPASGKSVKDVTDALDKANIEARPFWKPVHLQKPYREAPTEPCVVADDLWDRIVTLPCSTNLKAEDQDRVIKAVLDVFS